MNKIVVSLSCLFLSVCARGAVTFSTDDFFTVNSNASLQASSNSFTLCGWSKASTIAGGFYDIAAKWGTQTQEYTLYINSGSKYELAVSSNGKTATVVTANTFGTVTTGQENFTCGWFDLANTQLGIYVNGVTDTVSYTFNIYNGTSPFRIGNDSRPFGWFFGDIEDVRFYKRVLPIAEMDTLYKSRESIPTTDGLAGWWRLTDGQDGQTANGNTAYDFSGNGNNMTGNNGANATGCTWKASTWLSFP